MKREAKKALLEKWFRHGVERCAPSYVLPPSLPKTPPKGRTIVLGAGKAAAEMAAVAARHIEWPLSGCVVTRYGHGAAAPTGGVTVIEAGHPTPDENSVRAATTILAAAAAAGPDDLVLFMISGGGSALLTAPIAGVTLEEKRQITEFLVKSGAPIEETNFIRKHLSKVKGGRLATVADPAAQMTYIISDVVGDKPEDIASGPTMPMEFDVPRALLRFRHYGLHPSAGLKAAMTAAAAQAPAIALRPFRILAASADALAAIEIEARRAGWRVINLGALCAGDAHVVATEHVRLMRSVRLSGVPTIMLSGGELTVRVANGAGRGGPNLEYLAAMMLAARDDDRFVAFAGDSDGIDGTGDNAGGYVDDGSFSRARKIGLNPQDLVNGRDTYALFSGLGDLVVTGPTRTNVNDIRIIMVNADEFPN